MHDIVGVSITVATILAATLFSSQPVNGLRTEVNTLRADIMNRLDSIQRDIRDLYAERARHDVRITSLEQHKRS